MASSTPATTFSRASRFSVSDDYRDLGGDKKDERSLLNTSPQDSPVKKSSCSPRATSVVLLLPPAPAQATSCSVGVDREEGGMLQHNPHHHSCGCCRPSGSSGPFTGDTFLSSTTTGERFATKIDNGLLPIKTVATTIQVESTHSSHNRPPTSLDLSNETPSSAFEHFSLPSPFVVATADSTPMSPDLPPLGLYNNPVSQSLGIISTSLSSCTAAAPLKPPNQQLHDTSRRSKSCYSPSPSLPAVISGQSNYKWSRATSPTTTITELKRQQWAGLSLDAAVENQRSSMNTPIDQKAQWNRGLLGRYTRLVARHPWAVIFGVLLVSVVLIVAMILKCSLPKFGEPSEAFQTVGTELSGRLEQFINLEKNTSRVPYSRFVYTADHRDSRSDANQWEVTALRRRKVGSGVVGNLTSVAIEKKGHLYSTHVEKYVGTVLRSARSSSREQSTGGLVEDEDLKKKKRKKKKKGRRRALTLCDYDLRSMSRFVVSTATSGSNLGGTQLDLDLLSTAGLAAQCRLERRISRQRVLRDVCLERLDTPGSGGVGRRQRMRPPPCCPLWSLANYVAVIAGKPTCQEVNSTDVLAVRTRIIQCIPFYRNRTLNAKCWVEGQYICQGVPYDCQKTPDIFNLLHFILPATVSTSSRLSPVHRALVFLPLAPGSETRALYAVLERRGLLMGSGRRGGSKQDASSQLQIEGIHFGLSDEILNEILIDDTRWLILSACLVFVVIWFTTSSLILTLITLVIIGLSLLLGFFCYQKIFLITYFPFVNLMAVILALALGADDVFIYVRIWYTAKKNARDGTLEKLVSDTLRHACLSIFVTTLTTSAALYANSVSNIVAIKCFVIYAGTVILINYLLMITCVPACIVLLDWNCRMTLIGHIFHKLACLSGIRRIVNSILTHISVACNRVLLDWWPSLVIQLRYLSCVVFLALTTGSFIVVFYTPGFTFPSTASYTYFEETHPFALYERRQAKLFIFEREREHENKLPISFVWGALPRDTRSSFDPRHRSNAVVVDPTFNLTTVSAQRWLHLFCSQVNSMPFLEHSPISQCPLDLGLYSMQNFVRNQRGSINCSECCGRQFPMPSVKFEGCTRAYSRMRVNMDLPGGFRYTRERGLAALFVHLQSNVSFEAGYREQAAFHQAVETWFQQQLLAAPPEMRGGFFTSTSLHYDLHHNIAEYLPLTLVLSVLIAALVMFAISLNFLVSLYAVATILGILFTTVATLTLAGWKIDIIESVIIILAIGLSIDFCIHMAVAYRLSKEPLRINRARSALVKVGTPTLAAAMTTILAGVGMLPSRLTAYRQMAVFLIVVTVWAWFFASVLFIGLLAVLGPEAGFGQLHWPRLIGCACCCLSCRSEPSRRLDKTVYSSDYDSTSGSTPQRSTELQEFTVEPSSSTVAGHQTALPSGEGVSSPVHHHPIYNHHHHKSKGEAGGEATKLLMPSSTSPLLKKPPS